MAYADGFVLTCDKFLQFVTISQPINAVAFVADGLYYGVSDFAYAAYSTVESLYSYSIPLNCYRL